MNKKEENSTYAAPALDKGLDILEALCKSETGLTQQEIASHLGRKLGEIYRMLTCLVRRNYVANHENVYTITSKLFQLSHFHPPTYRLVTEAIPLMEKLSAELSFPCDLRVYNKGSQTVIASIQPPNGLGFMTRVGAEIAVAPSASGLVLVAFQEPEITELRIQESLAGKKKEEIDQFRSTLDKIRKKGFASIQSNQYAGVHAIAFPIFDARKDAIAALTVPMLARIDEVSQPDKTQVEASLRKTAAELGFRITMNTHKVDMRKR